MSLIYRHLREAVQLERVSGLFLFLSRPALLRRRLVHHGFELHAVGVGEIDRVIGAAVIFAGRIDHIHAVLLEESAERVHVVAARKLEGVVVEADVALAVLALLALRVGGGDPEQRLAVAPAGHVGVVVFELEAEKAEQLAVELLRAGEVANAEHQVIDADDAGHGSLPRLSSGYAHHTPSVIAGLDPAIHRLAKRPCVLRRKMDPRVKPGGDGGWYGPLGNRDGRRSSTAPAAASRRACRRGRRSSAGRAG